MQKTISKCDKWVSTAFLSQRVSPSTEVCFPIEMALVRAANCPFFKATLKGRNRIALYITLGELFAENCTGVEL